MVVLKVGRNERTRRAITSHTGGLAGEARVFSEVLKRHRAIEVGDMDELTEVLACCQGERWPAGRKLGVMTASGGQAELILDVAGAAGLRLLPLSEAGRREAERVIGPLTGDGNPLDAWGDGKFDVNIPHGLKVLEDEPDVDSIVMVSDSRDDSPMVPTQYTQYLAETARRTAKPCFFMNTRPGLFRQEFADALRAAGVPTIGGARQGLGRRGPSGALVHAAVRAAARAAADRPSRRLPAQRQPAALRHQRGGCQEAARRGRPAGGPGNYRGVAGTRRCGPLVTSATRSCSRWRPTASRTSRTWGW